MKIYQVYKSPVRPKRVGYIPIRKLLYGDFVFTKTDNNNYKILKNKFSREGLDGYDLTSSQFANLISKITEKETLGI